MVAGREAAALVVAGMGDYDEEEDSDSIETVGSLPFGLDEEVERKRREMAEARAQAKAAEKARLDEENRAFAARKKATGAATVNKLSAEEQALRDEEKRKDQSGRALGQGMKGGKLDSYPIGL